jgi:salicylate 5-hydroxylase large subunit
MDAAVRRWTESGETKIPYWVYTDQDVYQSELERIWYGPHWLYAGLEAEVPEVGSYRTTTLGERPVVVVRSAEDQISVLENRCRHRGVQICQARFGKDETLTCPYHQWSYALDGALQGVPFRRGIKGKGGMPSDFSPKDHGLRRLKVEVANGVIWASFDDRTPPFREYIGKKLWGYYERIFTGRRLRVIGYNRQLIPSNWKLMMENIKDPYHAALLHVFFATFGLFRPDQKSALEMDETGRHACLMSVTPPRDPDASINANDVASALPGFDASLQLADKRLIEAVKELKGEETIGASTIFPSVILLQQVNSLQTRQFIPKGPDRFELIWTHFGFDDDDTEMQKRRIRHANLFGPAGFVSADDSEVVTMAQNGFANAAEGSSTIMEMGGRDIRSEDNMATESAIRGMYHYYREVMGL